MAQAHKFRKGKSLFATTLVTGIGTGTGDTITLNSTTGLPTDAEITLTFNRVDGDGTEQAAADVERITGIISGATLTSYTRAIDGTTEQAHLANTVVEYIWNADDLNDLVDGILEEHDQSGDHKFSTVEDANGNETLQLAGVESAVNNIKITSSATGNSPIIEAVGDDTNIGITLTAKGTGAVAMTSPKITTGINDSSGNELIKVTATGSAVNELTLANAATGNSPVITMSGGDSNVGLDLKMKGAAYFRKPTVVGIQVFDAADNTATGDGKAFFRVPAELNGMNLTGVAASVYTAGTTGTLDIQFRNKTDSQDILSVKLTIDSGETDSSTAATAGVINPNYDDVVTGDILEIDVDAVHTTPAKGLFVELRFELPA